MVQYEIDSSTSPLIIIRTRSCLNHKYRSRAMKILARLWQKYRSRFITLFYLLLNCK